VWLTVEKIDFDAKIAGAENFSQKQKWTRMKDLVTRLRENPEEFALKPPVREPQSWKLYDAYDVKRPLRSR
jgi:hypothetical protein